MGNQDQKARKRYEDTDCEKAGAWSCTVQRKTMWVEIKHGIKNGNIDESGR
jgi:hypothetical protein